VTKAVGAEDGELVKEGIIETVGASEGALVNDGKLEESTEGELDAAMDGASETKAVGVDDVSGVGATLVAPETVKEGSLTYTSILEAGPLTVKYMFCAVTIPAVTEKVVVYSFQLFACQPPEAAKFAWFQELTQDALPSGCSTLKLNKGHVLG